MSTEQGDWYDADHTCPALEEEFYVIIRRVRSNRKWKFYSVSEGENVATILYCPFCGVKLPTEESVESK